MCFNSAATVSRCIQSVAKQTYDNIEHIVIDGASSDGTVDIIKSLNKDKKLIFISERDAGIYDAMNKGLRIISGEIVCFLNSDDQFYDENVLSSIASMMEQKGCDALLADVVFVESDARDRIVRHYPARRFRPSLLKFGWMPPHPGFFARRSVYEKFGFFDTSYKIAGDFDFIARVFQDDDTRYDYFSEPVVKMSVGGVSNSGLASKILLNKEVLRSCRKNGINTNWLFLVMKYPLKIWDVLRAKIV